MADLVYPVYPDGLAIYSMTLHPELKPHDEIADTSIMQTLAWAGGDGYTNAFDQLCAVQACARVLGHDEVNIGLVALIYGRWIVIKQSSLTTEHVR
jgi:hypothetical protein